MKIIYLIISCFLVIQHVNCLPVTQKSPSGTGEKPQHAEQSDEQPEFKFEYDRYLKEIVSALETDPEFRQKLDKADEADIRSGKIAQELEYVNHNVRTKLDEIKRQEIERLRHLAIRQHELSNHIDRRHLKIPEHLDHQNQHTFEIEDLRKLILKTSSDLAEADRRRREEFKQYEMQKEFEKQEKLKALDSEHRKTYEEELKKQQESHNKHDKVHHPGNKAQLEEVWEKQDHMEGADFDPKTFFMLHDVDSNGFWDENEVKALFVKELDKVYQQGLPEDDMRERAEEMERMREHVFTEADINHDGLISYEEFIEQTKRDEFQRDPGWDTVDNQQQFTHEEYLEFERRRQEEIQRLIAAGVLPPNPNMPGGYHPNQQQGPYQAHPNDIPHGGNANQQYHYQQQQQQQQYQAQQMHQQQQQYQQQFQQQQYHPQQQQQPQQYHPQQGQQVNSQNDQSYQNIPPQQQMQNQQQPQQHAQNQQPQVHAAPKQEHAEPQQHQQYAAPPHHQQGAPQQDQNQHQGAPQQQQQVHSQPASQGSAQQINSQINAHSGGSSQQQHQNVPPQQKQQNIHQSQNLPQVDSKEAHKNVKVSGKN